jgi:hypothetical protein
VKAPKQNCPRCNSLQSFRERSDALGDGTIVVFIACTMCRWRRDLRTSTQGLEELRRQERRLLEQARRQHERHGVTNNATRRGLLITRTAMALERKEAGL